MRRRWQRVSNTPALVWGLLRRASASIWSQRERRAMLLVWFGISALLFAGLLTASLKASIPVRAEAAYDEKKFLRAAELYDALPGNQAQYNAAGAFYRAGEYERALMLLEQIRSSDPALMADVYHNAGNAMIRLKEFAKAQEMFRKSLALRYDAQTEENLLHILFAESQDHMLSGRQEGKKRAQEQEAQTSDASKKKKEGGGSERQQSAQRQSGAGAQGKKVKRDAMLDFSNRGGNRLSSKQYELINRRSVHETKPW